MQSGVFAEQEAIEGRSHRGRWSHPESRRMQPRESILCCLSLSHWGPSSVVSVGPTGTAQGGRQPRGPLIVRTVLPWTSLVANRSEKLQEAQRVVCDHGVVWIGWSLGGGRRPRAAWCLWLPH